MRQTAKSFDQQEAAREETQGEGEPQANPHRRSVQFAKHGQRDREELGMMNFSGRFRDTCGNIKAAHPEVSSRTFHRSQGRYR